MTMVGFSRRKLALDPMHLFSLLDRMYQIRARRSQIDPSGKGGPILWLWDVKAFSGS